MEEPGLRIHFRLPGDADTTQATFEVTAKDQLLARRTQSSIRSAAFL